MSLLLSDAELQELTKRKRAAAQCRALDAMGIAYLPGPEGQPRVLRSYVERMMGGEPTASPESEPEICFEPPTKGRATPATVHVLQARRLLAGEEGPMDTPRHRPG
jgi:hypothetical protein